jgi:Ca2+-binding RTX toxin-like protein
MDEILVGTSENDRINGLEGNDTILGKAGPDRLDGGEGNDSINGGGGNDIIFGGDGEDTLNGGVGNDSLFGGSGNDTIYGEGGRDIISGGIGDDLIYGNNGNDSLNGNNGKDTLDGGDGIDTLTGGGDRDRFDFVSLDEGKDLVTDFQDGLDTINVSQILAAAGYDSATPFEDYVELVDGTDSTFGVSGTAVTVDPDGDSGSATFVTVAFLEGITSTSLSESDFIV